MNRDLLFDIAELTDDDYGSNSISLFLYSLVRMHKPGAIVELGAGLGASGLWMAYGVRENGRGHVWSVDSGADWPADRLAETVRVLDKQVGGELAVLAGHPPRYGSLVRGLAALAGVNDEFTLVEHHFKFGETSALIKAMSPAIEPGSVGVLFDDISCAPHEVISLLGDWLPYMAPDASIFIDRASTIAPVYLLLERIVEHLNSGKIPVYLMAGRSLDEQRRIADVIQRRRFQLIHLVEAVDRPQNSTAWLRIEPVNVMPYPLSATDVGFGLPMLSGTAMRRFEAEGIGGLNEQISIDWA